MIKLTKKSNLILFLFLVVILIIVYGLYLNDSYLNATETKESSKFTEYADEAPETIISKDFEGHIKTNSITFEWIGVDDYDDSSEILFSYALEGLIDSWSSWTNITTIKFENLTRGNYTFHIKAKDSNGHIEATPVSVSFFVDIDGSENLSDEDSSGESPKDESKPDTSIIKGVSGELDTAIVYFEWTGFDDTTTTDELLFSYFLEGRDESWSSWSYSISVEYNNLENKDYIFKVKSKDEAGNVDSTPASRSFKVNYTQEDVGPPDTNIIHKPGETASNTTVFFEWIGTDDITVTENLRYSYMLEGKDSDWSDWDNLKTKTYNGLNEGMYIFKVKSKDEAGNVDSTPAIWEFNIEFEYISRYASKIIEFTGEGNTNLILGGPRGKGDLQGSTHVLSIGNGENIILGFDVIINNGPGKDFTIFENPFYIGSSPYIFGELVFVEVSTDGESFARFPTTSITENPIPAFGGFLPGNVTNFGGINPVYANIDENDIDPFNSDESGGDSFDLSELSNDPMVISGLVDLNNINYVKIIDIIGDGSSLDSLGAPIFDPTGAGNNGADIDSIAIINYLD